MERSLSTEKQNLFLSDRRKIDIDGVEGVVGFDEDYVTLITSVGKLSIEGEELIIENLSKETGKISIKGKINAIIYSDKQVKKGFRGLFS